MDRRSFGTTLLTGLVGAAAAPTLAQYRPGRPDAMPMGPAEERHAMDTLAIGAVALETSRLARDRALRPAVRQFAQFGCVARRSTGCTSPARWTGIVGCSTCRSDI
jgi:hypothetical protein